jgi:hypothetical protein
MRSLLAIALESRIVASTLDALQSHAFFPSLDAMTLGRPAAIAT